MPEARNIDGTAFRGGSATLMARIVGANGANIVRADLGSIHYTISLLDDQSPDERTAVAGHDNVALDVAGVIFNTLQTDTIWTVDTAGYNFRHAIDVSTSPAFAIAGRRYLVEYRLMPVAGQIIIVRFRINVV